jgi:secreted PhoX family phosphatase
MSECKAPARRRPADRVDQNGMKRSFFPTLLSLGSVAGQMAKYIRGQVLRCAMLRMGSAVCLLAVMSVGALGQTRIISTYAGPPLPMNSTTATTQAIDYPESVVPDGAGGFYVSSGAQNRVYRVATDGKLTAVAGSGLAGYSGDAGPATAAKLNDPRGIAVDVAGNLYVADRGNARIRKVTPEGVIHTVAGNGTAGYDGDGGPATAALLNAPLSIAVDTAGNLYTADAFNHRIRKVNSEGMISTVAGNGTVGYGGDGGSATAAQLNYPSGVAVDTAGNLYIVDWGNARIRKVTLEGVINTVAGNGTNGYSGDGGSATTAQLWYPEGAAVDTAGNLYIADTYNYRIRKVTSAGVITTVAGKNGNGYLGDGGPATAALLNVPRSIALDPSGNLYIADTDNHRIRKVTSEGVISTVAGNGTRGYLGDGGPATAALLSYPYGVAVDAAGSLYIADAGNNRIRKVTPEGMISTVAGNGTFSFDGYSGDGGPATAAQLHFPTDVDVDAAGNLYIADCANHCIRKVTTDGIIQTVAGNGTRGSFGDGGPATAANLNYPKSVAVDAAGNIYIQDAYPRIRKVTSEGVISTVAGIMIAGYSGDGGPATAAALGFPTDIALDASGNLYISEGFARIRKVTSEGVISTVAGIGTVGYSGDGGPATAAQLGFPCGLALDMAGNLYIADDEYNLIRKVTSEGVISTAAGNGTWGYSGDGGPAREAQLGSPYHIAVDTAGSLYIADIDMHRIRKARMIHPAGAFDGDGRSDILWRHTVTGDINVWLLNGASVTGDTWLPRVPDQQWQIAGIGDFNGDGDADVLWRYTPTGDMNLWLMNGTAVTGDAWLPRVSDPQWQLAGVGDFNKDGKSDVVWRNTASGDINVWFMNGGTVTSDAWLPRVTDQNWQIVGIGDFNGDGGGDIVWRYSPSGDLNLWLFDGISLTRDAWLPRVADAQWQINAIGDFNGDGNAEIVWRHTASGDINIWFMNGASFVNDGWLPRVADQQWKIFGPR